MKSIFFFVLSILILASCATHSGTFSSSSPSSRVVYEDVAMGVVTTSNFLGIGGTNKDGLMYEAKKNLITNRPLQNNEEYLNFTVDYKRTNYLLVNKLKVTMTCDVVSRTNDTLKPIYSEKYKAKVFNNSVDTSFFKVGDSIINVKDKKGVIVSITNNNEAVCLMKGKDNSEKTKVFDLYTIFSINKTRNSIKVGDTYSAKITLTNGYNYELKNATIIGVGLSKFVVVNNNGEYYFLNYPKTK